MQTETAWLENQQSFRKTFDLKYEHDQASWSGVKVLKQLSVPEMSVGFQLLPELGSVGWIYCSFFKSPLCGMPDPQIAAKTFLLYGAVNLLWQSVMPWGRELVTFKAQWPHSWGALQCSGRCGTRDAALPWVGSGTHNTERVQWSSHYVSTYGGKHLRELLLHMGRMLTLIFSSSFSGSCFSLNYLSCAEGFITVWQFWFILSGNKGRRMCLPTNFQNMHVQMGKTLRKGEKTLL